MKAYSLANTSLWQEAFERALQKHVDADRTSEEVTVLPEPVATMRDDASGDGLLPQSTCFNWSPGRPGDDTWSWGKLSDQRDVVARAKGRLANQSRQEPKTTWCRSISHRTVEACGARLIQKYDGTMSQLIAHRPAAGANRPFLERVFNQCNWPISKRLLHFGAAVPLLQPRISERSQTRH